LPFLLEAHDDREAWVDGRVDVLLIALHDLGMSASRAAAAELIQERVRWVSAQAGIAPTAARRYLTDDALTELARTMVVAPGGGNARCRRPRIGPSGRCALPSSRPVYRRPRRGHPDPAPESLVMPRTATNTSAGRIGQAVNLVHRFCGQKRHNHIWLIEAVMICWGSPVEFRIGQDG
jgi:hypothetical protein